jgi:hypothetical protein
VVRGAEYATERLQPAWLLALKRSILTDGRARVAVLYVTTRTGFRPEELDGSPAPPGSEGPTPQSA